MKNIFTYCIVLGWLVLFGADVTAAQEPGADRAEEIVVTARRRSEALQDYAGTASVFNEELLEEIRIDGLEDIVQRISNAHFEERSGNAMNIWIRGAGTSTSGSATNLDTGVALYYDGVYSYIQGSRVPLVFYDMESIEVFKGPQGSLYGRNAVGGAVAATTARPHYDFEAFGRIEAGDYDMRTAEGRLNVPLSDSVALRVSGYYDYRDSYYENVDPDIDEPDSDRIGGRLRLRVRPNDALDILFGYERLEEDTEAQTLVPFEFYDAGDEHLIQDTTPTTVERSTDRVIAQVSYTPWDDVELRSLSGYIGTDGFTGLSLSNLPLLNPAITVFQQGTDSDRYSWSQEFILSSTAGSEFEWLAGLGYYRDRAENDSFANINGNMITGITSELTTEMYAVFGDLKYFLTDNLALGASVRYAFEERDGRSSSALLQDPETGENIARPDFPYHVDYDRISPGVTLSYYLDDDVMVYAKVATAYQAGGINTRFTSPENAVFGASPAVSYEGGLRATWLDARVTTNLTVFRLIQDDYQFRQNLPPANPFQNIGEATTDGVEVEVLLRPTDWLSLPLHFGYLDGRITDGDDAFSVDGDGITGDRLRSIPRRTYGMGADARVPMGGDAYGYLRADLVMAEDRYEPFFSVATPEDYEVFNMKLGVEYGEHLDIYLFGENLTDERYVIAEALGAVSISPPRTVGIGVTVVR